MQHLDAASSVASSTIWKRSEASVPAVATCVWRPIHSFFHYVALQEPALGALAQRVLAIKSKRHIKKPIDFLTRTEAEALLSAPDQRTWSGRRDRALLLLALQTGLRLSEIINLCCQDIAWTPALMCAALGKDAKPGASIAQRNGGNAACLAA